MKKELITDRLLPTVKLTLWIICLRGWIDSAPLAKPLNTRIHTDKWIFSQILVFILPISSPYRVFISLYSLLRVIFPFTSVASLGESFYSEITLDGWFQECCGTKKIMWVKLNIFSLLKSKGCVRIRTIFCPSLVWKINIYVIFRMIQEMYVQSVDSLAHAFEQIILLIMKN